jgi:hypothetical protein
MTPSPSTGPPDSTAFDCSNLAQGSYPNPADCCSFFICLDGKVAGMYKCDPSELFDPIKQTCNIKEKVICYSGCEEGEVLPHPSDCSKYFACQDGSLKSETHTCPAPLLFDTVLLKRNLPQLVTCSTSGTRTGRWILPNGNRFTSLN